MDSNFVLGYFFRYVYGLVCIYLIFFSLKGILIV